MAHQVEDLLARLATTFNQIAKFARKERRWRVLICPRMKPKSMKITSATMTIEYVNISIPFTRHMMLYLQQRNPLPLTPAAI